MNRLSNESSPYLRQHAGNPVDWHPWGDEAFELAASLDKPVLLSVGYASCHWCHVMAHESFEDEATAKLMNECFVNIKVDREERPDIDAIYMEATQAMSGQGGWPMTVVLNHERQPFFAGTYFPKRAVGDMPTFTDVIRAIDDAWRNRREQVDAQGAQLRKSIAARTHVPRATTSIDPSIVSLVRSSLIATHDHEWGGFGSHPKFPQASTLELLLQLGDDEALATVKTSLDAMASGGIYDHIGGGFARYSVDAFWMVPHFEKMLYDQASLARVYLHAFQVTHEARYRQVVEETIEYVLRDLRAADGAFYSSEDADSEGEEGRFYVWRPEQIDEAAGEYANAVKDWYGVTHAGNFEGSNILHRPVRGDLLRPVDVERGRELLLEARNKRVRPGLDDKILVEWNAMFIATLAEAGAALKREEWVNAATRAATWLIDNARRDVRWLRSPNGVPAFASDYAWLATAFTALGEATGVAGWRQLALETVTSMLDLFEDPVDGGLFTTGNDAEQLIVRNKDMFDSATTSANSTAAVALARIAAISDLPSIREKAEHIASLATAQMQHYPTAFTNMAIAFDLLTATTTETVIAGEHPELVELMQTHYLPHNVLLHGERPAPGDAGTLLWEGRFDGAFVCKGTSCAPAAHTVNALKEAFGILVE